MFHVLRHKVKLQVYIQTKESFILFAWLKG